MYTQGRCALKNPSHATTWKLLITRIAQTTSLPALRLLLDMFLRPPLLYSTQHLTTSLLNTPLNNDNKEEISATTLSQHYHHDAGRLALSSPTPHSHNAMATSKATSPASIYGTRTWSTLQFSTCDYVVSPHTPSPVFSKWTIRDRI